MSKKKIILGSIALLIIISIIIVVIIKKKEVHSVTIQTEKVKKQKIVEKVTATGRIQPKTQVKISADVAAKIIKMDLKEGDFVNEGDFLLQLDRERFLASVESAEANLRAVKASADVYKENMGKTEKDYKRTKMLYEKKLESKAVYEQVYAIAQVEKARYKSALEQVEQAKASLKQAQDALSKTSIYAPMTGTISELNKEVGEIALGSQFQEDVIMVISDLSVMEAVVSVDENDIVSIELSDSANIEVDALPETIYKGLVSEIANSATITGQGSASQKTEFEVKIIILNPGMNLRPGMTASSDIVTKVCENVLGVPIQSVTLKTKENLTLSNKIDSTITVDIPDYNFDKEGFVQVVFLVKDNKVIAKQVDTGIQGEDNIQIIEGLEENDEVVTGSFRAISQELKNLTVVKVENKNNE